MSSNSSIHRTTDQEYIELLNFLIEKTEHIKSPMEICQLAAEFKEKSAFSQSLSNVHSRICNVRQTIHRVEGIDDETKVRVLFALSAPIDTEFLKKLKERAYVILDHHRRIIVYKKKEGGLELSGTHKKFQTTQYLKLILLNSPKKPVNDWIKNPEYIELANFLIEKTRDVNSPMCTRQLAGEFKEKCGAPQLMDCLRNRIHRLRWMIQEICNIDMDTKVRLLFALSVPIDNDFLEYLQTQAKVLLDNHHRIIEYREKGGEGLELKGIHPNIKNQNELVKRDERMIKFLAQKSMEVDFPMTINAFLTEFKKATGATETINCLGVRYKLLKYRIPQFIGFDQRTKIRMLFVSGASVPNDFLEILRKDALVEIDKSNRIINYKANDGNLELQGDHTQLAKPKAHQIENNRSYWKQISNYFENNDAKNGEMGRLIEFITEKCKSIQSPLRTLQLAKEFSDLSGIPTKFALSYNRIRGYCRVIQKLDVLDTPTKVRQLFGLGGTLNDDFLEKLREEAFVEVDHRKRIINYTANDGSLKLEGRHWRSSRPRQECSANRNKIGVEAIVDSFDDEEGLDDDSVEYLKIEFDSEFESDDANGLDETEEYTDPSTEPINHGQCSEKSEIMTTGSGRMSKKRNIDVSPSPQKQSSSEKRALISKKSADSSKWINSSETNQLEGYDLDFDNFQEPEVKLEPFRGSLIDGLSPVDPEDDIKVVPSLELREPKKEVEEEQIDTKMMEFPIKTEEDFIIPKQEELEADIKPEIFF